MAFRLIKSKALACEVTCKSPNYKWYPLVRRVDKILKTLRFEKLDFSIFVITGLFVTSVAKKVKVQCSDFAGRKQDLLEWSARQKIAIGAARGLRYLHEECRVGCIVHRDMRPNNILLTHDFEPLVCHAHPFTPKSLKVSYELFTVLDDPYFL